MTIRADESGRALYPVFLCVNPPNVGGCTKELPSFVLIEQSSKMVHRPTTLNTYAVLQSLVAHVAQSDDVLIPVARNGARHRLEATLRRSCHRTSNNAILYAVGCLRDSRKSNGCGYFRTTGKLLSYKQIAESESKKNEENPGLSTDGHDIPGFSVCFVRGFPGFEVFLCERAVSSLRSLRVTCKLSLPGRCRTFCR